MIFVIAIRTFLCYNGIRLPTWAKDTSLQVTEGRVKAGQRRMKREKRAVRRYAGPRMLLRHPVLALFHLADGLRKNPSQTATTQIQRSPVER